MNAAAMGDKMLENLCPLHRCEMQPVLVSFADRSRGVSLMTIAVMACEEAGCPIKYTTVRGFFTI